MKKILLLTSFILLLASYSFAAPQATNGASDFTVTNTAGPSLTFSFSSQVWAVYENGGDTAPQWYAIATSHRGGTQQYGTAQDVTNFYKLVVEKVAGEAPVFNDLPTGTGASNVWSGGTWTKM